MMSANWRKNRLQKMSSNEMWRINKNEKSSCSGQKQKTATISSFSQIKNVNNTPIGGTHSDCYQIAVCTASKGGKKEKKEAEKQSKCTFSTLKIYGQFLSTTTAPHSVRTTASDGRWNRVTHSHAKRDGERERGEVDGANVNGARRGRHGKGIRVSTIRTASQSI